ncbi:MAG: homocysteine S-methyltransferase family protein [Deltaproteobacteria bacterium]|nr:homocysteine S-methyltransferase family protein [Deltaproteobacteria bacterium]
MKKLLKRLHEEVVVFDGATGTMLQERGLKPGACPDEMNLTMPDAVKAVHKAYVDAGSDIVTTCTFGANRIKLEEYNLGNKVNEINSQSVKLAKEAVHHHALVAGGIGPTGKFIEPVGDLSFDDALKIYSEQAQALANAGADCIIIETMMDIREMKAAIMAAKETGLPVIATMTFDETMRTVLGTSPEVFAIVAESIGADIVGANCSLGAEGIFKAVEAMSRVSDLPLIAQPNAGIPYLKDGRTVFPAVPSEMAEYVPKFLSIGVRIIGGCCGTTPEHIRKMGSRVQGFKGQRVKGQEVSGTKLASRSRHTIFGNEYPPIIIGERINPTGKKAFAHEILEHKTSTTRKEAKAQQELGADALDVNMGVPGGDEPKAMKTAIFAVNENCHLPVVIDSSSALAIEAGLKSVDGKALINSVSGEEKRLSAILPLAKKYGAAVLGLTLDKSGIPKTAEHRFKIAEKILNAALDAGLKKSDVVIDCLAMTVSADQKSARETLKAIRLVKEKLGLTTILGVSNISFGLPNRDLINANFLSMAIEAGLDAAIINPHSHLMMDAYHASLVLAGKDIRAERYIRKYGQKAEGESLKAEIKEEPKTIGEKLKRAIIDGDEEGIVPLVEEAIKQGWEPLKISNDGLVPGLEEVGRLFGKNIYFLPQIMLSADTMKLAFERLKKELKGKKGEGRGKILMATVEGDIHDIGKNIVSTLLENHGFDVIDLGKNVPADKIIDEAVKNNVDIVGLSALMTTTVTEMENVIKKLKEKGINVITMVGGAVVTPEFADKIGAASYAKDALEAVEKAKGLIKTISKT